MNMVGVGQVIYLKRKVLRKRKESDQVDGLEE